MRERLRLFDDRLLLATTSTLATARRSLRQFRPHIVLVCLDLDQRGRGICLCREIRGDASLNHTGVLILGRRVVGGQEAGVLLRGADLCLSEDCYESDILFGNVTALLKAVCKRTHARILHGPLLLCEELRRAWIGPREMTLTTQGFRGLVRLARSPGQPVTGDDLVCDKHGDVNSDPRQRAPGLVHTIREALGSHAAMVETVHGKGCYRLCEEPPRH